MLKTIPLFLISLLWLMACAPETAAPAQPEPVPTIAPTADAPISPTTSPTIPPAVPSTVDFSQITPEPNPETTPNLMPAPGMPANPQAVQMTNMVTQDLAEQLKIETSDIEVVDVTSYTWPDSSMGCPEPGMNYLMVITPGYRIVLEANGETYNYHTDESRYFVLCKQKFVPISPSINE